MDRVCPEEKEPLPGPGIFISWQDAGKCDLLPNSGLVQIYMCICNCI